jgi:hypothetical protein
LRLVSVRKVDNRRVADDPEYSDRIAFNNKEI